MASSSFNMGEGLIVKSYSANNLSFGGGEVQLLTASAMGYSSPSGYTPIATRSYSTSTARLVITSVNLGASGSGTTFIAVKNITQDTITGASVTIQVLYAKSNQVTLS